MSDPRGDSRGSDALDIASVGQGERHGLIQHRLTTHDRWTPALLVDGGQISFYFDTNADSELERRLDVRYVGKRLSAVMTDQRGRLVGRGLASQLNSRTVVVEFARSLLRPGIRRYRWFAFTGFRCHRYKVCGDTAPRRGTWISHRLGHAPSGTEVKLGGDSRSSIR